MEQMENVLRLYVLKEEQCHAVLGLLEQKDFVAFLPTGFGKTLIIFLLAAVNSNEEKSTWNCSASALRSNERSWHFSHCITLLRNHEVMRTFCFFKNRKL